MAIIRLLFFLLISASGFSQGTTATDNDQARINATTAYYQFKGIQPVLYNGPQHYGYSPAIKSFAYFPTNEWTLGSVGYDKLDFQQVPLMYDAYADQLVVKHIYGISFTPFKEKIDRFNLGNVQFIRLNKVSHPQMDPGFYQVATDGAVDFLIRHKKIIKEDIINEAVQREFIMKDKYFLRRGDVLISISNQKDLAEALADKKKEVSQFTRRLTVRFRKQPEQFILETVQFYNQLSR